MYRGIAISGKIASGKTTLARILAADYGIPVIPLAYCLKADVAEALSEAGLAHEKDLIVPDLKPHMRGLLQDWGLLFRNLNGEDYWVQRLFSYAKSQKTPNFIVDDMRFRNEFHGLQRRGFLTIRLDIGGPTQEKRLKELYPDTPMSQLQHTSETDLDNMTGLFDIYVTPDQVRQGKTISYVQRRLQHYDLAFSPVILNPA